MALGAKTTALLATGAALTRLNALLTGDPANPLLSTGVTSKQRYLPPSDMTGLYVRLVAPEIGVAETPEALTEIYH